MIYFLHMCACVCVYVCVCASACTSKHVCIHTDMHIYRAHTHAFTHTETMLKVVMPVPSLGHLCTTQVNFQVSSLATGLVLCGLYKYGHLNYHLDLTTGVEEVTKIFGAKYVCHHYICHHYIFVWGKIVILWSDCEIWKRGKCPCCPPCSAFPDHDPL